ncbi:CarD family transcriptional regulator [Aneurinibacillus soli]|uniref:RNA polymerase-binding transcription factor CarD n=1 Tax=Aneurinibacillus soli TaxID=1500254 RepID=A0A0U5BAM0_9BACL|nr:CarD family transcriptional regulator [Aneurinibacillus soli]BAU27948.1 RNA polymerase-binding transcription factor CarD [Aneurinibacillus soli]
MLFQVGDKVVYPMHGAGIIEAIEEKEILGEKENYYVIHMSIGSMQLLVPVGKVSALGIRLVVDQSTMENVLDTFHNGQPDTSLPWSQRYRLNMDKMRTGTTCECAEVVRDLMRRRQEKALNSSEKKMLDSAKKILISELVLVNGVTEAEAKHLLDDETE